MSPTATPVRAAATPSEPSAYRFDHPRLKDVLNDMYIPGREPGPGDQLDPFELVTLDGHWRTSAALLAGGQPLLLVFGSLTCPVTASAGDGLKELHARYGSLVHFVLIQVREAHPGDLMPQPKSLDEKRRRAADLKDHHAIPFEVLSDDMEGTFHRRLGARPNSLYVIDSSHRILFRAQWANETAAIAEALDRIVGGEAPPNPSVTRTFPAMMKAVGHMSPTLKAAGRGARCDLWEIAPPMGMMMLMSDLLVGLPRDRRGAPAMILTMLLIGALAAAVVW